MRKILTIIFTVLGLIAVGFGGTKLYSANTLPTCDSEFAENIVLEWAKEKYNVDYYADKIESLRMHDFVPLGYDSDIKKYMCKAIITLDFKPGYFDEEYYVGYAIYKERGQNTVVIDNGILRR